ncbi:hypothetical protein NM688_g833 [Phlebia brevispora]|uniref:Uncharacterized protein n=1 Tax=Phlebia brevispora TaxID=194682 RepID=A0ACC1TCV2_9APHY|nr:hypothetical protein NM688_g833 [Phlebia brevispora]
MHGRARRSCRSKTSPTPSPANPPKYIPKMKAEKHEDTLMTHRRTTPDEQVPRDLRLGMPTREQYTRIEQEYLNSLSVRKREKALLTQEMFDDVWDVLHNPKDSKLRTPQFRFWVRKMFVLSFAHRPGASASGPANASMESDVQPIIMHENRPVALKEQIYDIISYCHRISGHGGRDRTMALVRERYSWIPKELIAQYIKICPTCVYKKTKDASLALSLRGEGSSSTPVVRARESAYTMSSASLSARRLRRFSPHVDESSEMKPVHHPGP